MTRSRWLGLLLLVPLAAGLFRLRFDADVLNLLPADLPSVAALQLHQRYFANARELVITVRGNDPAAVTSAAEALATRLSEAVQLVRAARWQAPWIEDPSAAAENLAWMWLQQPPEEFARLAARLSPTNVDRELTSVRETLATSLDPDALARASYDPLGFSRLPSTSGPPAGFDTGTGIFVNEDGTFRVIYVDPAPAHMNYTQADAWLAAVRRASTNAVAIPALDGADIHLGFTGTPAFVAEIATGMERDLTSSVLSTVVLIALLFWLAHRSWRPLGWLVVSLGLTLVITLALGGLVFGTLNVISLGFAAVLMGLAVDYGLVSYQEAVAGPGKSPAEIRREVAHGIGYSAVTTAGTFLLLGFAGLPGLAQLGALTAIGLLTGAVVMLFFFLPRVCPVSVPASRTGPAISPPKSHGQWSWWPTGIALAVIGGVLLWRGLPSMTASDDPLRPRHSPTYAAMEDLRRELGRTNSTYWLLFSGAVGDQLDATQAALAAARDRSEIDSFELPTTFWPRPRNAADNRKGADELAQRSTELRRVAMAAGFTTNSLALAGAVLTAWSRPEDPSAGTWPTNAMARFLTGRFSARTETGEWLALGLVQPGPKFVGDAAHLGLPPGVAMGSWDSLSTDLAGHVTRRVTWLTLLIGATLIGFLRLAFRNWREVGFSLAALALGFAMLLGVMTLAGWSWNLLSLVALPLLLGSSVDSTIHVQLALRRHGPDRTALWRITGKALLLCAGANIAGFGSLAWSSNAGLASLDLVCAVGVACVFVVCVGLLPTWWIAAHPSVIPPRVDPENPSSLYTAGLWRAGLHLGRLLPAAWAGVLARAGVKLYLRMRPERFDIVVENLLPFSAGDRGQAERLARANFEAFAAKLVDLWRYEAGVPVAESVQPGSGWDHFSPAVASGRGVLLVTPHLGNWEFGAPFLGRYGIKPLVLTAPEPAPHLTRLRADARARQGVETLVVGEDPFAFVEIIRRLQDGGVVALLIDRPNPSTAVPVELLGRPFLASVAAAELARATGCVVLPVFIVREAGSYRARALPPVEYEQRQLRDRAERIAFTGRILRALEPAIRQFPDQWFHFVPVWDTRPPQRSTPVAGGADSPPH